MWIKQNMTLDSYTERVKRNTRLSSTTTGNMQGQHSGGGVEGGAAQLTEKGRAQGEHPGGQLEEWEGGGGVIESRQTEVRGFVNLPLIRLALPGALMPAAPSVAIVAMGWMGGWEQSSRNSKGPT